jgi:DNA polymerase III delta subunit
MNGGLIEGNSPFLVRQRVNALESGMRQMDWDVVQVQGSVKGSVETAVAGNLFFGKPLAVFVWDPAKDLEAVQRALEMTDQTLAVFLVHVYTKGSTTNRGVLKKAFPSLRTESFNEETRPWKMQEFASEFVTEQVTSLGWKLDPRLCSQLVARVGTDLGTLYWEIKKAVLLAKTENAPCIEAAHLKRSMAPIASLQPSLLLDALSARSEKRFLVAAEQFRRSASGSEGNLVKWVVGWLSPSILSWAVASSLAETGTPPALIAKRLGETKWKVENVTLPACKRWVFQDCCSLLGVLSDAEQAVVSGAQSPWILLVGGLSEQVRVPG